MAFCQFKLVKGENGNPILSSPRDGLAFRDVGEGLLLPLQFPEEFFRGVIEREYRGGVMYLVDGVTGGVSSGSSPRRARCDGVKAISVRLSFFLTSG